MKREKCFPFVLFLFITCSFVFGQEGVTGTGSFDINKVREAVVQGNPALSGDTAPIKVGQDRENYALVMLRVIGYLAIITALIFGVAWLVKKAGLAGASKANGGAMDVLEVLPFGQSRNAVLIRVLDKVYLLGQTPNSITLLEKIEGQNAIDLIASSKGGTQIVQFKDAFNSFISKIKRPS